MVAVVAASVGGRKNVPAKENKEVLELFISVPCDGGPVACLDTHQHAHATSLLHSLSAAWHWYYYCCISRSGGRSIGKSLTFVHAFKELWFKDWCYI